MKLTTKDKEFLERLRQLMESKDLSVELRAERPSFMILRGTYGEKIHKTFAMSRQGVRWRFHRLMNDIYVSAFETILVIEKTFGSQLRDWAIRISRERYALRQQIVRSGFQSADTLTVARGVRSASPSEPDNTDESQPKAEERT
jgi:hypothetical protein